MHLEADGTCAPEQDKHGKQAHIYITTSKLALTSAACSAPHCHRVRALQQAAKCTMLCTPANARPLLLLLLLWAYPSRIFTAAAASSLCSCTSRRCRDLRPSSSSSAKPATGWTKG
jgi:hypothetical protein